MGETRSWRRCKEGSEEAENGEEKGMKLSITEGVHEGKSKAITSCNYLEEKVPGMQQERRSCFGNECSNTGRGLENENRAVGAKEKARWKKCDVRFSLIRKIGSFRKNSMRTVVRKLLRRGEDKLWALRPTERLKWRRQMAAAAAGKKGSVSLSLFLEVNNLEVEEELSTMATLAWTEGCWLGKWIKEQQKAWR